MFENRAEAGKKLAAKLLKYKRKQAIVLGIPRGGVVTAFEVAKALNATLDLVISRKLGAPHEPELAIGAVAPDGSTFLDEELIRELQVSENYIEEMKKAEMQEIERRMKKYRGTSRYPNLKNKIVIIVDDGIATGATVLAAVKFLRKLNVGKIVVAVPVMPQESVDKIKAAVDELVVLETPSPFYAVGMFYKNFPQTSDEEVIKLLKKAKEFVKK
jgi:putative phosphoribosyl transferase